MKNRLRGFTLIELSIVLVIIGLLAGGVLVGRELIRMSEIRSTVATIEKIQTGVNTFRGKYNCIPGDCANAVGFGLGTQGGVGDNGSGDGLVDVAPTGAMEIAERMNFWYHLAQAGMISGTYTGYTGQTSGSTFTAGTDFPALKIGGGIHISQPDTIVGANEFASANIFWLTNTYSGIAGGKIIPAEQFILDTKLDDGLPGRGKLIVSTPNSWFSGPFNHIHELSASGGSAPYGAAGASSNFCATNATIPVYNSANTGRNSKTLCVLEMKAGF